MTDEQPVVLNAYQLGMWFAERDEIISDIELQIGDPGFDYGFADDGWPIPPPCIVCGVLYGACTH